MIWPSICGCTVVERSDFSVATYSLASSIGAGFAAAISTGVGGIPWPGGGPAGARLHALATMTALTSAAVLVVNIP